MFPKSVCVFVFAFQSRRQTTTLSLGVTPHTRRTQVGKKRSDFWITTLNISLMRARHSKIVIGRVPSRKGPH